MSENRVFIDWFNRIETINQLVTEIRLFSEKTLKMNNQMISEKKRELHIHVSNGENRDVEWLCTSGIGAVNVTESMM